MVSDNERALYVLQAIGMDSGIGGHAGGIRRRTA